MTAPAPDQDARDRIAQDLVTNLIVEAGAGSGKTTALVGRMLQHVMRGTPVEQLAAVTFTRKAADELRERFQLALEDAARNGASDAMTQARCAGALRDLERGFLGTIHSFCARLLRERPIEVGLDPQFVEIADADVEPMNREFWRRWIDTMRREGDDDVAALYACAVDPTDLHDAFRTVMQYHDVEFVATEVARPDPASCLEHLQRLMARAAEMRAIAPPSGRQDALMLTLDRLQFHQGVSDWSDPIIGCTLLETLSENRCKITQLLWAETPVGKKAAKELETAFLDFFTNVASPMVERWREYRYPIVMRVLQRAVRDFAQERHDNGTLGFDDLLFLCAKLLREHRQVRNELGARYRYLLVDEFQDTDPVQAEVCLLLASEASEGSDWQAVTPRAGALFVVGDPKQSIYRFRRADIQIYERVKARFGEFGATLALTANFRSTNAIGALVNRAFAAVLPVKATAQQAAFSPLETQHDGSGAHTAGVFRYVLASESRSNDALIEQDAECVAAWIATRIAAGESPGGFLVLTDQRRPITAHARALASRNIAVTTTGADLMQEYELDELMIVLSALADPTNPVLVAATLEGLFFGLSPADLLSAKRDGLLFSIATPAAGAEHPVREALAVLRRWWEFSQLHPTDVLLERIFDDTGLLFLAAGSELGDARAGALLHLVETVRASAVVGRSGLIDAIAVLQQLLECEADDAPLRPGRTDAVRVMNLHKAKGLEAEIVILASPVNRTVHEPMVHVTRSAHGGATGGLLIGIKSGSSITRIAQPVGWSAMQAEEAAFAHAEADRLRYVATTRAKRALVIGQAVTTGKSPKPDTSMWRPLAATADVLAPEPLDIPITTLPERRTLDGDVASYAAQVDSAAQAVALASRASVHVQTVTGRVKGETSDDEPLPRRQRESGRTWGTAVHRCLDALVRGRRGASLHAFVRAVVADEGLDDTASHRLQLLLDDVASSARWRAATEAGSLQSELSVMLAEPGDAGVLVTEGVIDLAVVGAAGWRVIDWKSDRASTEQWSRLAPTYERQVARYAEMLSAITALPARGTIERVGQG
ncbi:MAG: UvrD-helicase domain-containing protein [Gemmatimonadaceae bacterium]|nr:UvrD-helicase domain-containing protein [Gemmatimonadaceae bacterium]